MNYIQAIVKRINVELLATFNCNDARAYGLTELVTQGEKTFPIEVGNVDGCKIIFDDRKPIQIYHRLLNSDKAPADMDGRGDRVYERFTHSMRLFVIGTKDSLEPACEDTNLQWMSKADAAIARKPNVAIGGIMGMRVNVAGSNTNYSSIISTEFPGFDTSKLNPLKILAFSIDYSITGNICGAICV